MHYAEGCPKWEFIDIDMYDLWSHIKYNMNLTFLGA